VTVEIQIIDLFDSTFSIKEKIEHGTSFQVLYIYRPIDENKKLEMFISL